MMELYIKNMVCDRCIKVVSDTFRELGVEVRQVQLGVVQLDQEPGDSRLACLAAGLGEHGFELLDSVKAQTTERIKNIIIAEIHHADRVELKVNWSDFLSEKLCQDYSTLSSLFSTLEGTTIEQYIIRQKIERVKELLSYDELNLSEISYKLGYSSLQHLSTQFKKVTGLTPSQFRQRTRSEKVRRPLDSIL